MGINLNNDRDEKGRFKKSKVDKHHGTYEDMINERKKRLPEMSKEIEKFFDDWDGGTVLVVKVSYDENGDGIGAHEAILGVDKPENLMGLAKHLKEHTIGHIIEHVSDNSDPKTMLKIALKELEDLLND